MGKTKDTAQELLDRTEKLLDDHFERRRFLHGGAVSGLLTGVAVLEDVLGFEDEGNLSYSRILELWENELTIKEVNGL